MASLLVACAAAVLPRLARLGLPHGIGVPQLSRSRPVRMQLVWGQEPEVEQRTSGAPSLMELSVSYGWCLSDVELAEMQSYQVSRAFRQGGMAAAPACPGARPVQPTALARGA
jgi:hypothetical protein